MKRRVLILTLCWLCSMRAAPPIKWEPICLTLEPAVMKFSVSHVLTGARQTILSPAVETADGLKLLDEEAWKALNLTWEAYQAKATEAAARLLATLTPEPHKDARGTIEYLIFHSDRHFASSIILCPELWKKYSPMLGPKLVALCPDRFTVYLFPRETGGFVKQGPTVAKRFAEAIYPASVEAFEISETSFISIGNFTTSDPP